MKSAGKSLSSHFHHADMRQSASSSTFPSINNSKKISPPKSQSSILQQQLRDASPTREKNQFNRLSGLGDAGISNGLFSEIVKPIKPSNLCVRCGAYASICMSCSDQVCEDTLTFYRKTRASGAVALFTKAFVEAGNSKLVKFFMFRLWKNSLRKNQKQQLKMKNVVERLFGSNVVYLPFAAWKKYTKENIMDRKNAILNKLKDKTELLESQVLKIAAVSTAQETEIRSLRTELTKCKAENEASMNLIKSLQSSLKKERHRVVGMSSVLNPLAENWKLLDKLIEATTTQVRTLLLQSGKDIPSYDYSHVFTDEVIKDLQVIGNGDHNSNSASLSASSFDNFLESENRRAHAKKVAEQAVSSQIVLNWIKTESLRADAHGDPYSGALLSKFLPAHENPSELSDLSNGKILCRVVIGIIYDKLEEHERLINSRATTPGEGARSLRNFSLTGRPKPLSAVELHTIKGLHENPFDLITLTLKMGVERLQIPAIKVTDIFAGRTDVLYALCVALMVLSIPTMDDEAVVAVNLQIQSFQHLMLSADREREQEREREHADDDEEGDEDKEDEEEEPQGAYLENICKINNLQEMFDLHAKEESSDLYPRLAHKEEGQASKLFMQTLMSVSETTFNEDGSKAVSCSSIIEADNSTHRGGGSAVATGGGSDLSNAALYKALTSEVDALLARVTKASQPLQRAVKSKASRMDQLIHLESESIRLRELRDDGMRLTTSLRKLVLSNLINHGVVH